MIKMKENEKTLVFSIKTNTTREALCCARLQHPYVDVAAPTAHVTRMAGLREQVGANNGHADKAHRLLGQKEPDATRAAAAHPPGKQIECEACALE